jgi:glycosyltransferase involved in cell wall biosynthesis
MTDPSPDERDEVLLGRRTRRPRFMRRWAGDRPVKLSLLMPAYNEEDTILAAVDDVLSADYPCEVELVVVDDGSTDATGLLLRDLTDPRAVVLRHPRNFGKGAALQTAAAVAKGSHLIAFDADLEYSAADVGRMLEPVVADRCDVVYGTRVFGLNTMYPTYRYAVGNRALTLAANLLFDSYLSDLHTCLKLMPVRLFRQLDLREAGFGIDTEITGKLLALGIRPFEVPISYYGRSHHHGKKITWRHGVECLQILAKVRMGWQPPLTRGMERGDVVEVLEDELREELVQAASSQLSR